MKAWLYVYSDADWAGDPDDPHSTTGNFFLMAGGPISWLSKKQLIVALSTSEAEYIAPSSELNILIFVTIIFMRPYKKDWLKYTIVQQTKCWLIY